MSPSGQAPQPPGHRGRDLLAAAGGYVLLALLATWPLVLHFGTHAPGSDWWGSTRIYFETPVNLWNLWWFRHALTELGQSPFTCQLIFYPYGADLWLHTLAPLHGLVGAVFQSFVTLAAAQNLMLILDLAAAGSASFALGRHLGLERGGAFLAGAIFAFCPAVFGHLYAGHYELLATYWLPLMLLLFLRLAGRHPPRLRDGAALGLAFAAAAYSCQYYVLYGAELLVVAALAGAGKPLRRATVLPLAAAALLALAGMTPLLLPFLLGAGAAPLEASGVYFAHLSGDLLSFFVPSFTHPLLSELLRPLHERLNPLGLPQETTTYLGFSALGLAMLGLGRRKSAPAGTIRLLGSIVVVFAILSLGSRLKLFGIVTGIPLPAALLEKLPLLGQARAPGRHVVLVLLGLGMLAGLGWPMLRRAGLRWAALGLLALEYVAAPLPLYSTEVSPAYHRLAGLEGTFAVLEVPFGIRDGQGLLGRPDSGQIFAQTVHGHPILGGMVSRLPPEKKKAILSTPVAGTLLHPQGVTASASSRDMAEGPEFFARWRIRAILIHPQARSGPEQRYLERVLPIAGRESFADGTELLWVGAP